MFFSVSPAAAMGLEGGSHIVEALHRDVVKAAE
jgi:hypothetical protein